MPRPLLVIASGAALLAVDFRTESLDLLLDPLGWILIAAGASMFAMRLPVWSAAAAALLSTSDAFLPYRYVLIDPVTGEVVEHCPPSLQCPEQIRFDPVSGWRLAAIAATVVVGTLALVGVLRELRRRALAVGDRPATRRLLLLSWAVGLGWGLPSAVAAVLAWVSEGGTYDPIWNGNAEYVALIGWAVLGWVILELCLRRGARWAIPEGRSLPSPWSQRY